MIEVENETRSVVDALYEAYLAGDSDGMLAQMADDVEVRFLAPGNVSRRSCGQTLHAVLGRAASPPRLPHQKDDRRRRRGGRDLGRVRDHGCREAEGEPRGGRDSEPGTPKSSRSTRTTTSISSISNSHDSTRKL
jgi:hypothetical protein